MITLPAFLQTALDPVAAPYGSLKSRRGSQLIMGSFFVYFIAVGLQYAFGVIFKALLLDSTLPGASDRSTTSWVSSLASALFMFLGLAGSHVNQRQGPRMTATLGGVLASLGFCASSFVPSVHWLFLTYSLPVGVGCCFCNHASLFALTTHFPASRATALGLAMAGGGIGSLVLGPGLQLLIDAYGWRVALRALGALSLLLLPLAALPYATIKEKNISSTASASLTSEEAMVSASVQAAEVSEPQAAGGAPITLWTLLSAPTLRAYMMGVSLYSGCFFTILLHLVPCATEERPHGPALSALEASALISYQGISNVLGRLTIGRLTDHAHMDRVSLQQSLLGIAAAAAAGLAALPGSKEYITFYAVIFGLCAGSIVATSPAILAEQAMALPQAQASAAHKQAALALALGLNSTVQTPLILLLPPLAGAARQWLGSYQYVWAAVSLAMAIGAGLMGSHTTPFACCFSRAQKRGTALAAVEGKTGGEARL